MEILIWIVVGSFVGYLCGKARGREGEGVAIGLVLGPLGWLIMLCAKDKRERCAECGGVIIHGARKCCHCGSEIVHFYNIKCPACGERGKVREAQLAEQIECPACKRVFSVRAAIFYTK